MGGAGIRVVRHDWEGVADRLTLAQIRTSEARPSVSFVEPAKPPRLTKRSHLGSDERD